MDQIILKSQSQALVPLSTKPVIPDYLKKTYHWAYIDPTTVSWLDRGIIVWAILWGNSRRLMKSAFEEIKPGGRVLQAAYVYGDFSPNLARHVGENGQLDVIDIVPLQVENCRRRLKGLPQAKVRLADAAAPGGGPYDGICCYFLLHEMPHEKKVEVIRGLLDNVAPGGKAVFVDYHKPVRFHPLGGIMNLIWRKLEPFTMDLLETEISTLAGGDDAFTWSKQTFFGGLYQKVVATRR
ncbi:MAG: rhodoquinone biosynthesis methyltransferase RquA [Alphaproteobacteria bacterium]|nr:rhodoquinone biosynthesis methyltransferase RquA [Rhodospirillales bacterium]MCW9046004.1 rhodoquinone biosynthesis methyltransferase RquA [Alphaproteobacteria bacterium]